MSKKLDLEKVAASGLCSSEEIAALQVAVYVMCGGGQLGLIAAERPADFYIDQRVGRLPYGKKAIEQAVDCLIVLAEAAGMNPKQLKEMPRFHSCGIF